MRRQVMAAAMGVMAAIGAPEKAQAYDIDCAILLCMAGGFPPSDVCGRAYRTMIQRITPWPSTPPIEVCPLAPAPSDQGGGHSVEILDITGEEFEWLENTHVIWFSGRAHTSEDDGQKWTWSIESCDLENNNCQYLSRDSASDRVWPSNFTTEAGQRVSLPYSRSYGNFRVEAVMVEYGDHMGNLDHSNWVLY